MSEENWMGHLGKVPNPDGGMIQLTHKETFLAESKGIIFVSPTKSQLRSDPLLLEFGNVKKGARVTIANYFFEQANSHNKWHSQM